MKEKFLFSNTLSATTVAADVKALAKSYFDVNELSWQNFKRICTDGAPAMIGAKSGFVTLVKNKWPHVTSSHSSLHQYILASKTLPLQVHLMEVMDVAVKVINFIRSRANNYRLFHSAKEMDAQHVGLLFYAKVRWLSRDKCLFRLYDLKNEIEIFLRENKNNPHVQFHNKEFVVMLAYLADVFGHLNDMNLSLQGRDVTVSDVKDKLAGLTARMGVWQARIKVGSTTSFHLLERRLKMNSIDLSDNIKTCIIEHLEIVSAEFRSYFHHNTLHLSWYRHPFNIEIDPNAEEAEE